MINKQTTHVSSLTCSYKEHGFPISYKYLTNINEMNSICSLLTVAKKAFKLCPRKLATFFLVLEMTVSYMVCLPAGIMHMGFRDT